jgi:hypothetical protein
VVISDIDIFFRGLQAVTSSTHFDAPQIPFSKSSLLSFITHITFLTPWPDSDSVKSFRPPYQINPSQDESGYNQCVSAAPSARDTILDSPISLMPRLKGVVDISGRSSAQAWKARVQIRILERDTCAARNPQGHAAGALADLIYALNPPALCSIYQPQQEHMRLDISCASQIPKVQTNHIHFSHDGLMLLYSDSTNIVFYHKHSEEAELASPPDLGDHERSAQSLWFGMLLKCLAMRMERGIDDGDLRIQPYGICGGELAWWKDDDELSLHVPSICD